MGPRHRVFFSGDTGPTESLREVARREGPFDVALIEIGQWNAAWGDIHLGPVGALDAFERSGAKVLIPIHWSTFVLAYHAWSEPAETLVTEAAKRGAHRIDADARRADRARATPLPKTRRGGATIRPSPRSAREVEASASTMLRLRAHREEL